MKPHQDGQDEPFFITEEIEAEMIAAGTCSSRPRTSQPCGCMKSWPVCLMPSWRPGRPAWPLKKPSAAV